MSNKFNVACFQTNSSDLPKENILELEKKFSQFAEGSIDLICLPECVSIFSDLKEKIDDYVQNWHKIFINLMINKAKKIKTNILIGSFPFKKKNKKFFNRCMLIDKEGKINCFYDKINLFDVILNKNESYLESKYYDPGKNLKLANLPWGKLGMSICYDLRFPGLYKKLAKNGADFFSIPAAFTYTTGKYHWHSLIKARAIENGCFVFAPAQCGYHKNGRRTYGHSLIVDPWGNVISQAKDKSCIITASIDVELIVKFRKKIPSMTDYSF